MIEILDMIIDMKAKRRYHRAKTEKGENKK